MTDPTTACETERLKRLNWLTENLILIDSMAVEMMSIRPDIPVILCTGYSKKMSQEAASDIGIQDFAYKPIVQADLAKTVRKVLDADGQNK